MLQIVRETFSTILSRQTVAIWIVCCFCAVTTGPFGTFVSMSFALRLIYWPIVVTGSIFLGYLSFAFARWICGDEDGLKRDAVQSVIGALLVTTSVWLFGLIAMSPFVAPVGFVPLVFYVAFVFVAVTACRALLRRVIQQNALIKAQALEAAPRQSAPPEIAPDRPLLAKRLNGAPIGEILRLTADNHFVEVVSDTGATSLRMRFRDAIAEMNGVQGGLVHRSHWVAYEAVEAAEKAQGKLVLRLRNGDEVPVSRSYRADLENSEIAPLISGSSEQS